jgi:hypothetical protein
LIVPVAALPPETVVPRAVVVPYWNFGVVDVDEASIVPLNVAESDPMAVGLFVLTETPPAELATLPAVHPPAGSTAASSFAFCWFKSVAISESVAPAAFITS